MAIEDFPTTKKLLLIILHIKKITKFLKKNIVSLLNYSDKFQILLFLNNGN